MHHDAKGGWSAVESQQCVVDFSTGCYYNDTLVLKYRAVLSLVMVS